MRAPTRSTSAATSSVRIIVYELHEFAATQVASSTALDTRALIAAAHALVRSAAARPRRARVRAVLRARAPRAPAPLSTLSGRGRHESGGVRRGARADDGAVRPRAHRHPAARPQASRGGAALSRLRLHGRGA